MGAWRVHSVSRAGHYGPSCWAASRSRNLANAGLGVIVVGCDPGINGAVAVLRFNDAGGLVSAAVHDMPTIQVEVNRKQRRRVHLQGCKVLMQVVAAEDVTLCAFENVHGMGGQDGARAFEFGRGTAYLEAACVSAKLPLRMVEPGTWKGAMRVRGKASPRLEAQRLFPGIADMFTRVKDDGRAEACLIAAYAARKWLGAKL